jgi:hypothetical protein
MLGCFNVAGSTSRSDWLLVGSLCFQRMPENYVASSIFTRKNDGLENGRVLNDFFFVLE